MNLLLFALLLPNGALAFGPVLSPFSTSWGVSNQLVRRSPSNQFTPAERGEILSTLTLFRNIDTHEVATRLQHEQSHSNFNFQLCASPPGGDDSESDTKEPVKIIIAGAPASGKGTQCEIIKDRYGLVHLSTGDMLRAAVAAESDIGKLAKEYMDSGKLVPDEVIIDVVKDRLMQEDCLTLGWLLDGFPRTQAQAKALADAGVSADCFLFLNVPDEILVERVVGRRTDPVTGKIYHLTFSPPPADIVDRLVHRSDDTEEKVKIRLEQFHANVEAVKDSYTDISVTVDGSQAPDKVSEAIFGAIQEKINRKKVAA